jgi:polar amino acid transport system substrate-binding protein
VVRISCYFDWVKVPTKNQGFQLTIVSCGDGHSDAYLQDNVVLYYWARKNPEFHVLPEQIEPTPWAPAVKEGNKELKEWVNNELSKLGKEQYLHKLYEEYLRNELGSELDPDDFVIEGSN